MPWSTNIKRLCCPAAQCIMMPANGCAGRAALKTSRGEHDAEVYDGFERGDTASGRQSTMNRADNCRGWLRNHRLVPASKPID